MNLKVLMLKGIYKLSGSTIVLEKLSEQLIKRGVDITIGALKFNRKPPINFKTLSIGVPPNFKILKKLIQDFDIIHNHHAIMNYLAPITKNLFIYHYHGAPNVGKNFLVRFNMILSLKAMNPFFSRIISVSQSGAFELEQILGIEKVDVIYNGVNTNVFKPDLEDRFREGRPQLLFVGNLHEHKNVNELVFAFKELIKFYPKAFLQIVGEGSTYAKIKRLIENLGLQKNTELVGSVLHSELPYYYASCDVYVTASRSEVCPVPLLESMACGKPIIASSIVPHTEILSKSKAGIIYLKGDVKSLGRAMIEIYEKYDDYKKNALNFAKKHDWSIVADKILKIYEKEFYIRR